jgi:geranylgeranyl pyrophosphate synthase
MAHTINQKINKGTGQSVPREKAERERIRRCVEDYAAERQLVPPLSMKELRAHAAGIVKTRNIEPRYRDFTTVLMGNAVWRDTLATVPYHRRVLLLPQCLRNRSTCSARLDEFGLLCEQCGNCPTGDFQEEAERLGYVVLIAEGTTVVTELLKTGRVDAVVGVSCLSALERSFPYTVAAAVPGIAVPLYKDGCNDTQADADWIFESIRLVSNKKWEGRIDLDRLRSRVAAWFDKDSLSAILELNATRTERIASHWVATGGKRWRPFLSTAVFQAVKGLNHEIPETMKKLAVAVECFHKASLVHDDIEDNDDYRYDKPTLHKKYGVPIAINIGDLLVGEGYRLIAECGTTAEQKGRMLTAAALGHRDLCLGQGEELNWMSQPVSLSSRKVLEIFRRKTSPAFEVALILGAVCGGADETVCAVLKEFSRALGIAYQVKDDIEDFNEKGSDNDIKAMRPSLLTALALEHRANTIRPEFNLMWQPEHRAEIGDAIRETVEELHLEEEAWRLFDYFKSEAVESLEPLRNHQLKSLLYRIAHKVLGNRPAVTMRKGIAPKPGVNPTVQPGAVYFPGNKRSVPLHAM